MDNLTHSLFGLTLARTPLGRAGRGATVALFLASSIPDIDIVTTAGGAANYLQWHRGPTHGPLGIVGLALVVAAIVSIGQRWWKSRASTPAASFVALWLVSMVGVTGHILMDLPTSYGTRPLSPFSWTWFAQDWMPIVDVYLLAILAGGLILGRAAARRGNGRQARHAYVALALMAINYGVRASAHHAAIERAPDLFGAQLPARCVDAVPRGAWIDSWPRPSTLSPRDASAERCLVEVAAMPTFASPFRWRVIAHLSQAYELRDVDLLDEQSRVGADVRRLAIRYPNQWTPAVDHAAQSHLARIFLGFSRFPAAQSNVDAQGRATVRWSDMRFVMNPLGDQRPRGSGLFSTTVRVSADGSILDERLGP